MVEESDEYEVIQQQESEGNKVLTETMDEMDNLLDIPLEISAELGQVKQTIRQLLALKPGHVLELNKLVGEPMEIYINGLVTARGEVVVVNERFGVRVTDVIDPLEIIRSRV